MAALEKRTAFYFDTIISNLPEPIYWMDTDLAIQGCNEEEAKLFGLSPAEMIGKTIFDIANLLGWKEGVAEKLHQNDLEVLRNGKRISTEEIDYSPTGEERIFISHKAPLYDENKKIIGLIGTSINITTRKQLEMRERKALAEAEAAKARAKIEEQLRQNITIIAGSIAHELRTPLAAIKASANAVKDYFPHLVEAYELAKKEELDVFTIYPDQVEQLKEAINRIEKVTDQANNIINMLLINAKQIERSYNEFKECSLNDCITEALSSYPFAGEERKLVAWSKKDDIIFRGNKLLTVHILFNLLKNALFYIKDVHDGKIEIWTSNDLTHHILHFKDTGSGIDSNVLPHVFESFYSNTYHGYGLGLAFCRMVMQSYGGDISCDSIKNEYTEFRLRFPRIDGLNAA